MAYKYRVANNYNNRAGMLADIWTDLAAMGWTLHDDQSGSSYQVWKSNGESADRIYEYVKVDYVTANVIRIYAYAWWDAGGHAGSSAAYSYTDLATSESGFAGWIYGSKNLVVLMTKISTTYYRAGFGHFDTKFLTVETDLTAAATLGAHKSLVVTSSTGFLVDSYYQILGSQGEGRDKVQVESITDATHIVVVNLPRQYEIGAIIGQSPSTFGRYGGTTYFYQTCYYDVVGTAAAGNYETMLQYNLLNKDYINPNQRDSNLYYLLPLLGYEYNLYSFIMYNQNYILQAPTGAIEDVFYVGLQDSGTATSGTATTLVDTGKAWTIDALIGKVVVITAGTGVGQTRKITDNDATSITVATWVTDPDNTSQYVIVDECYRCLNAAVPYVVARESS